MRSAVYSCCTAVLFTVSSISASSHAIKRASLVGVWTAPGGSCEGDTAEVYRPDGRYETETSEGRWTLQGNRLLTTIEKTGEMGEPFKAIHPVERETTTILRATLKTRTERWQDGSIHRSLRCR